MLSVHIFSKNLAIQEIIHIFAVEKSLKPYKQSVI